MTINGKEHHGYAHDHHQTYKEKGHIGVRLLATLALNIAIPTAQIFGGVYASSMALISDAMHNFSDSISLLISDFAHRLSLRGISETNTFGYKRAEDLGRQIRHELLQTFNIKHAILQFETSACGNGYLLCESDF